MGRLHASKESPFVIAVAGNVGSGKTTLARRLAADLGWTALLEDAEGNPHLEDFYARPDRWAFTSQVWFLIYRFNRDTGLLRSTRGIVLTDRTLSEDSLFAQAHFLRGWMTSREFLTYRSLYESFQQHVALPNMVVYLQASVRTLIDRIAQRGNRAERGIDAGYIQCLQEAYDRWAASLVAARRITIDMDSVDFVARIEDYQHVMREIRKRLDGLLSKSLSSPVVLPPSRKPRHVAGPDKSKTGLPLRTRGS
jgi:deoxyadenosine/deoxycytidine kinase